MPIFFKARINILVVVLATIALLAACSNANPPVNPPTTVNPAPEKPATTINRVDLVYFHPKIRCVLCINIELLTKAFIETNYKNEMSNGKLTFTSYEIEDKNNTALIKKYGVIGSQLFINTVKNNIENIKHIEEIWLPRIYNDGVAFNKFLTQLISQALKEVS